MGLVRDHYHIFVNREFVGDYFPHGNEFEAWTLEQRLVQASLIPDFSQTIGRRIEIYSADDRSAGAISRYLKVLCTLG